VLQTFPTLKRETHALGRARFNRGGRVNTKRSPERAVLPVFSTRKGSQGQIDGGADSCQPGSQEGSIAFGRIRLIQRRAVFEKRNKNLLEDVSGFVSFTEYVSTPLFDTWRISPVESEHGTHELMTNYTYDEINDGHTASFLKTITDADVRAFAAVSGDTNPIHLDDQYAALTRFGRRLVHGIFLGALVSKVLGTIFPGPGAIYMSQQMTFVAPVYVGDKVEVRVKVENKRPDNKQITLTTSVFARGKEAMSGTAVLKAPTRKYESEITCAA
jgi:3-hydroxybutyryl-CoA dehydratase